MSDDSADIAIVGLACRFPGAKDADEFWRNLAGGVESITRLSDEDLRASGVPQSHLALPNYVKAAAVIDEPGGFDAAFFGYVPNEARTMDPQHRLLLELAHTALEDAGCDSARYSGRAGVFAGSAMNTYFMHAGLDRQFAEDYIPTLIVNDKDFLATRLSYKLNLKGPSLTVQTACSTSLVAVHLARQSLLSEEIDLALAGAVSVRAPHRAGYLADAGGVSSPDGHVRAFDAAANGTLFGSGGGVIVLKRLRDAIADGDTIRAIIKGSAVNNDGAEKAGYTAPSVNSQADAIVEALANADAEADSISYVETHGSGTPVGDPIEIRALTKAFRSSTKRSGFCAIGSVKTNVGHLDAAAGMAGLIKTVLALQHRQLPASLNYSRPNPEIDFPSTPFFVNTKLASWDSPTGPRRAGLMSTGMGGTNAHVVLEEAPAADGPAVADGPHLFLLSARTETALAASAERLRTFLEANPSTSLEDAAFTLQTGRRAMKWRRFLVGANHAAIVATLTAKPKRLSTACTRDGAKHPLVLLFPGVGDHYVGMGRELYSAFPMFRQELDRCAAILRPLIGNDIREILYPKNRDWQKATGGIDLKKMLAGNATAPEDEDTKRLNEVTSLQPALFAIEYATARLWMDLGLAPQAIVGHSMGEYVAACLAGVFSLEDALRLIVRRTQLVAPLPPASMLAVTLPEAEVQALLPDGVSISLINGPSLCVVAGPPLSVEEFSKTLSARGHTFRLVQNTHAFHSHLMDPIVGAFESEVRRVRLNRPQIPFISNVTGRWITAEEATDPAYWSRHLTQTARFHDALRTLWEMDAPQLLEAGPGKTLGVLANQHPQRPTSEIPLPVSSLRQHYENQPDMEVLLNAVGKLWLSGAEIRWEKLHANRQPKKIPLPTYPFERQNYWIDAHSPAPRASAHESTPVFPKIDDWFYTPSWERTVFPQGTGNFESAKEATWLILSPRAEDAASLMHALESAGETVWSASFGNAFRHLGERSFEIDPAQADDHLQLLRQATSAPGRAIHILHLGGLASSDRNAGFFCLLALAQAIGRLGTSLPVTVGIISSKVHDVVGDEDLEPHRATMLGACGVIPKEYPNVRCFNVDLPGESISEGAALKILSEFANSMGDEIVAYRGAHRWRRKLDSITLSGTDTSKRLRSQGVYLITGGTGGIGLAVARHLATACRARLILTKKTAFPEKSNWQELAGADDTPAATAMILRQLLEIENLGAEVEVMTAEVSDPAAMRRVFAEIAHRHGSLHGVVHAAGIIHDGLIEGKTRAIAEAVLQPKVQGCDVLYPLAKEAGAEFLVLFSSTAAVLGPQGQIDYTAANAYLDAFSQCAARQAGGPRTLSINWPGWREAGILANLTPQPGMEQWKEAALRKAIATADGVEAFRRVLDSDLPQVIVSPERLDAPPAARIGALRAQTHPGSESAAENPAPATEISGLPEDELEALVAQSWSETLGIPGIARDESFFDLGGHSLLALQMITKLRAMYAVDLNLREFFEAPTIAKLSTLIREKLFQEIAQMADSEVSQLISQEQTS